MYKLKFQAHKHKNHLSFRLGGAHRNCEYGCPLRVFVLEVLGIRIKDSPGCSCIGNQVGELKLQQHWLLVALLVSPPLRLAKLQPQQLHALPVLLQHAQPSSLVCAVPAPCLKQLLQLLFSCNRRRIKWINE